MNADGLQRDVTVAREAERELRESETRLRRTEALHEEAQRVSRLGHWELDATTMKTVWSDEVFRIFGLDPKNGPPSFKMHRRIVHGEDWHVLDDAVRAAAKHGTPYDIEFRILRPDGSIRWMHSIARSKKDTEGHVTTVFGTAQDITERKLAEEAVRQSGARYRLLFESSRDAIMTLEPPSWRFTSGNPAAVEMFGAQDQADFVRRAPWEYSPPTQPDGRPSKGKAKEMIQTAMREGSHFFEWQHMRLGGQEFPATVLLTRFELAGHVLLQATVRDISTQKALEAQLRQSQKLESIGTLAGGVAHEINNPVGGILNYAELILEDAAPDSPVARYATKIQKESRRVATIVRNLLSFAHTGKERPGPARLPDILESTLSLLRSSLLRDQITIEVDMPADLPGISCRSQQIQQVLMNLLTNARDALNEKYPKHHENKRILISAVERPDAQSKSSTVNRQPSIRLTVEDLGPGIPSLAQEHIFDPFYTTKRPGRGTGLGLAISHTIVKEHGGELSVESKPGKFTCVHVDLPIGRARSIGGKAPKAAKRKPARKANATGKRTTSKANGRTAKGRIGKRTRKAKGG